MRRIVLSLTLLTLAVFASPAMADEGMVQIYRGSVNEGLNNPENLRIASYYGCPNNVGDKGNTINELFYKAVPDIDLKKVQIRWVYQQPITTNQGTCAAFWFYYVRTDAVTN